MTDETINADLKAWIDDATYEELLSKWRFGAVGHPLFQGATGKYYTDVMHKKRDAERDPVAISKKIGWDNG